MLSAETANQDSEQKKTTISKGHVDTPNYLHFSLMNRRLRWIVLGISVLCWASVILRVGLLPGDSQWDFEICYYAPKAYAVGLNPYDPNDLRKVAVESESLRSPNSFRFFPYLPLSWFVFEPFGALTLQQAKSVFLLIQCVLVIYLLFIWQSKLLNNTRDVLFPLFCLVAFNSAMCIGIRAGNVNLVEQALIWSAFLFYIRERLTLFCILIVAAAVFKMTPFLFVGLLFLDKKYVKQRFWIILVILGGALLTTAWIVSPAWIQRFFASAMSVGEGNYGLAPENQSIFSLIRFLSGKLESAAGILIPSALQVSLYLASTILIAILSWKAFRKMDMGKSDDRKMAVYLACLIYSLSLPRFQDYQWIILLVPTYSLMLRLDSIKVYWVLLIFSVLSARHQTIPGAAFVFDIFWMYYQLILAFVIWVVYLVQIRRKESQIAPDFQQVKPLM